MLFKTILAGAITILPMLAKASNLLNYVYFPEGNIPPIVRVETNLEVPQGYDVQSAQWVAFHFNIGSFYLANDYNDKKSLRFWMNNNGGDTSVELVKVGENGDSTGSGWINAGIPFDWRAGVQYRLRLDLEFIHNDAVFTTYVKDGSEWQLVSSIRGRNFGRYNLLSDYQMVQKILNPTNQMAAGIFSEMTYRVLDDDFNYPNFGFYMDFTQVDQSQCWGYGITNNGVGTWMSVGGYNKTSQYCNRNDASWYSYNYCTVNTFTDKFNKA
ncbi:hypothetical protein K493DRAFT_347710 [Basidiobolus meristosporus CBS 931.73]|uniref:DUF5077 domain-containing protein n=1 Tax=Basidiobolus meristosporus CBS 931.73 TaxID=1314790 RepID=A0A1Y1YS10_9FUNG|nr:hypothetical protein K493DRAFT_347710 [Basidiobolus meristosporus CBS 931.73]|eukprot:ORY00811.1 hypothetical protein K493DRAFT_347710 [Basidiobolus meristosporus CBS 931.73]